MKMDRFLVFTGLAALAGSSALGAAYEPPAVAVSKINSYRGYSELTSAASGMDIDQYAYNMTTWQISNGGFYKAMASSYKNAYTGGNKSEWRSASGGDLATIDNNATVQELRLLAIRYKETTNSNYKSAFKSSFNKGINFLLTMQRANGGLPQVWPKRGNYSDHITLNDNAMIRAMVTMMDIANKTAPFDSDIIDDATRAKMGSAMDKAIDYLLKAQIKNDGNLTVWCAQHDTSNYQPRGARAYELPSKSGNESMGVVWFLMNWPNQTPEIQAAVKGAIAWYKKNKNANTAWNKTTGAYEKSGSSLWYRFYEVNNDQFFFCDRGGESTKSYNYMTISEERRTGYQWAGDYGSAILSAEQPYLTALEKAAGTYVEPPPPAAMCGSDTCKNYIDGVDFIDIKGVKEATNAGFIGEGYANVDNEVGSYVTYGVTALKEGKYTLFISFANGGSGARDFKVSAGEKVLVESASMESTGGWTTYKTTSVEVELPAGYSKITFTSLGKDGMANIDFIGWELVEPDPSLSISGVKIEREKTFAPKAYSGNYGKGAGIFYIFNGKKDAVRVNGRK
ncbi:pectate lyase [Fibrobacter sp. UWEL]|uniref:pectate lyase n=1 Tax=Fibrobacter sp. UWEL TaxID=1896209 RepID=UPI00090F30F4|nr:pectate lyase [Fibrobacter sp. UWEL]SHK63076.1 pectate lyase, PelA/Pel-15E family [Fibrobacter sp. UWEL]